MLERPVERAESFFNIAAFVDSGDRFAPDLSLVVVATHSPILPATPGANLYEFDERGAAPCAYDDLEAVRLTRSFLEAPDHFVREALAGLDDAT